MAGQHWKIADTKPDKVSKIVHEYGVTRPVAMILANRDFELVNIGSFLKPRLSELSDPFEIPGITAAVKRIWQSIKDQEPILIFGDYDTDGITATALIDWVLKTNGASVDCFVPNRMDDGYGLTIESLEKAVSTHKLVVTVDCGITSCEAVEAAGKMGIDVIITDHHQPGEKLPLATSIINPKLHPKIKRLHVLAGVGVCFKLCHGFIKYGRLHNLGAVDFDLKYGLDLVALGTVADIVPLTGENRCLVRHGMKILKAQQRPGVRALCDICGIQETLTTSDITFRLAPRLNAAGRLGNAYDSLKLLQTTQITDAYSLATTLDSYNRERQSFEEQIYTVAQSEISKMDLDKQFTIVLANRNWHPGVIGIVASKLCQKYCRPTIILSISEDRQMLGSGRSIPGIDLVKALSHCAQFLECLVDIQWLPG